MVPYLGGSSDMGTLIDLSSSMTTQLSSGGQATPLWLSFRERGLSVVYKR